MARARLKWKKDAFRKLRKEPKMTAFLLQKARQIAADAGGEDMGYMVTDLVLEKPRAAVSVMATGHATYHNRKYHSLLRALSQARER